MHTDNPSLLFRPALLEHWQPRSVVLFRALMLGDLLCSIPAIRALRHRLPDAHIALVGLPWAENLVKRFSHYINEFIEFPGYPGLPERVPEIHAIPGWMSRMQERRFDLAIQLHGSGSYVNSITALFGATRTAGFYLPGEWCPDPDTYLPFSDTTHEIRLYLDLMEFLGAPSRGQELEFPLSIQDRIDFASLNAAASLAGKPYVCVHPGARLQTRRWIPERFAAVADALAADGYRVVFTGSLGERELIEGIMATMREPAIDLSGRTTIGTLALVIGQASLLISNDTGVSHIASAVETPSVILTMGSDPHRWAPLDVSLHHVIAKPIACRPCMHDVCPIGYPCAYAITASEVVGLARRVLRSRPARPESGYMPSGVRA